MIHPDYGRLQNYSVALDCAAMFLGPVGTFGFVCLPRHRPAAAGGGDYGLDGLAVVDILD